MLIKNYPSKVATVLGLGWIALALSAGCQPTHTLDPCTPDGCGVPRPVSSPISAPAAQYVPVCEDTPDGTGPCVMGDDGGLWYVAAGSRYPDGRQGIAECADRLGTGAPCVWVPASHGDTGDSGAYVWER